MSHIISFCDELMYEQASNRIIDFLAWSDNPGFKQEACLQYMLDRASFDVVPTLNFKTSENFMFERRFKTISSKNDFFRLITIVNPTYNNIEEASYIDPCFAILMPIKRYLIDHPKDAKNYRGFLPYGSEVKQYWNSIQKVKDRNWTVKGSPTYKDHVNLQTVTNNKSDLSGIPTVTINTWMYLKGREMQEDINEVKKV